MSVIALSSTGKAAAPGAMTAFRTGDFAAYHSMVAALEAHGFSVGRMQAHEPTGVLFGDFDIQKWRNLSRAHRAALHGTITGDFRNGPVTLTIMPTAPAEARLAFERASVDA